MEKLQPQYGVETDSTDNDGQLHYIQVSERRRKIFEHPVVEFISRLAKHKRNTLSLRRSGGQFSEDLDLVVSKLALELGRRGLLIMEGLFTAFLKLFEQQLQGLDFLLQAQYGFERMGEV